MDDGELRYSEFSDAFMPQDMQFARLLGTKKLSYLSRPGKCPFLIQTLNIYVMLWETLIHNEKQIEGIRQNMIKRQRLDLHTAFRICDLAHDDYITISEVNTFINIS
jgi:hypothetical protein